MGKYEKEITVVDWDAVSRDLGADVDALVRKYAKETGEPVASIAWRARGLLQQRYFG